MNNYDNLDDILGEVESTRQNGDATFVIHVANKESNINVTVDAVAENTLGQIAEVTKEKLGLGNTNKVTFENKKTNKSTADKNMTLQGFGIGPEDCLHVSTEGIVA